MYSIDCDFPGGNILVDDLADSVARIHPDLRDTEGNWFYWCFRVRAAAGKTLRFEFTQQAPVGARGPAISRDGGLTWQWLGRSDTTSDATFTYTFAPDENEVLFSFAMTYTQRHFDRFLASLPGREHLRAATLCTTPKGHPVELFTAGRTTSPRYRVIITARHHCCEMMASYELEGILSAITADDDLGQWLRDTVAFLIVPFVDKDGVEAGDQGKNRRPRDHNRDYDGASVHIETAALRQLAPAWCNHRPLDIFLDLHCPWLRGGMNEWLYQVGSAIPANWQQQQRFAQLLQRTNHSPIPYRATDDLPFGKDWNVPSNSAQGRGSTRWAAEDLHARLATTIELPYANASGAAVTADSARALGHDLAAAIRQYLQST